MREIMFVLLLGACRNDGKLDQIPNTAPSISITSHGEAVELQEGFVTQFRAQASDDDNEFDELTVAWYIGEELICDWQAPDAAGSVYCDLVFSPEDTRVVTEIRDDQGAGGRDEISVVISPTEAPIGEIISPLQNGSYYSNHLIEFSALVSDLEDDPSDLIIVWSSSLDGELQVGSEPDSDGEIQDFGFLTEGQHAIELRVEDSTGKVNTESILIGVGGENTIPTCAITEPQSGAAETEGSSVLFQGEVSDPDIPVSELSIQWSSDKDGNIGSSTATSSGAVNFSSDGLSLNTHIISLTVTDEVGAACVADTIFTIGTPPVITLEAPLTGSIYGLGADILFQAEVSDPNETADNLSLSWSSDIDGEFSTQSAGSSGTAQFISNLLSAGNHTITLTATDSAGLYASELLTIRVSTPPTAPVVSLTPDPATASDVLIALASGSTDVDGDSVGYLYEWYQNGLITSHTTASLSAGTTSAGELWMVRVTPNDGYVDGPFSEVMITISNSEPELDNLSITPATVYNDSILTCSATVTDPDETLVAAYEWDVNGNSYSGATLDLSTTSVMPTDSISCTGSVVDSAGASAVDSTSTSVINRAPTIPAVLINGGGAVHTNDLVVCAASIDDLDGEALIGSYQWFINGGAAAVGSSLQLNNGIVIPGDQLICEASVTDGYGETASADVTITIANTDPTIDGIVLSATEVSLNDSLTCSATASDVDAETPVLSFSFQNQSNATALTSSSSTTSSATLNLTGTGAQEGDVIECSVTATDGYGGAISASSTATVINAAPIFSVPATINPNTGILTGTTLYCLATAYDNDDGALTPSFEWSVSGTVFATGASYTIDAADTDVGDSIVCTAMAMDSDGESTFSSASVLLENSAPMISAYGISPSSNVTTSSTITCFSTISDVDQDSVVMSYSWSNQGAIIGSSASISLVPSITQPGDVIECQITVDDGNGGIVSDVASVTIDNTPPVFSALTIAPAIVYNDSIATCSSTFSDADNETVTDAYTWTNTSSGVTLGVGPSVTLSSGTAPFGSVIECLATITDTSGGVTTAAVTTTVDNRAPSVALVSLNPNPAYADDQLSCNAGGSSDADGDGITYSYAWILNGNPQPETSSVLSGPFSAGDLVDCTVTPNDGYVNGLTTNVNTTILNKPPVVDSISVTPQSMYTNDIVLAVVVGSDIDGDPVTFQYDWTIGGISIQSGTSNLLDGATHFDRGDSVTVTVTPNDGTQDGIGSSASVTCLNTAPSTPVVGIFPTDPIEGVDDVLCSVTGVSSDEDGDGVTYGFAWTVDGNLYSSAVDTAMDSTVPSSDIVAGEVWECQATPNDGTDDGVAGSAVATIDVDWSGPRYFGNCSSTGGTGPGQSDCDSAYLGSTLEGEVSSVIDGIQYWTVPSDGTYQITAYGAAGFGADSSGGYGSEMQGNFALQEGDVLKILVGQMGISVGGTYGGGGGGSFVLDINDTPYIVAGGGGGSDNRYGNCNSMDASVSTAGNTSCSCSSTVYSAGNNGTGGDGGSGGGGGGGLLGNGGESCGGIAYVFGGIGGVGAHGDGGFGSGGGTNDDQGGGGGGYSGGGGCAEDGNGGGGASYNVGSSQNNTSGVNNSHGYVIIDKF